MAGVPFDAVDAVATVDTFAVARRLITVERSRAETVTRLERIFESGERPFTNEAYRALRMAIRTHAPPVEVKGEQPPAFHDYATVAREIAALQDELDRTLSNDVRKARARLFEAVEKFLPRYLLFGSAGMRVAVGAALEKNRAESLSERDRSARKIEQTLLMYLQRVATKNDTFSEFGPSTWGRIVAEGEAIALNPRPGVVAREAYLERWTAHAVAALINADLSGVADSPRPLAVPALDAHATEQLAHDIERWEDGPARQKWLPPMQHLVAMPARFRQAASPNERENIVQQTRALLAELGAERAQSDRFLYSAANPIGEECLRESNFAVGEDIVRKLESEGAPWIDLWRDSYAFVAGRVSVGLRQVLDQVAPGKETVPLPQFLGACTAARLPLQGPGLVALAVIAFQEVKAAMAERLRPFLDRENYDLTVEDCHVVRNNFEYARFDEYTYPSADLQLAAPSLDAVRSGNYTWIVSELHPPVALLHHGVYWGCPDPAVLNQAFEQTAFGRPNFHFGFFAADFTSHTAVRIFDAMPNLSYFVAPQRPHPAWTSIPPSEAEVFLDPETGDVGVRQIPSGEFLGSFARAWVIPLGFHPFSFAFPPHTPRLRCGNVIVQRQSWVVSMEEFEPGEYRGVSRALVLAVERLRASKGWPRHIYIRPTERALRRSGAEGRDKDTKPVFIDLESYLFIEIFHRWLVKAGELEVTEMLPTPGQLLWQEKDGRHTFEMRTMIVPGE